MINVLQLAQTVIKMDTITYHQNTDRTLNDIGVYVSAYTDSTIQGNLQPIQKNLYQQLGLDLQKNYGTLHIRENLIDVSRGVSGDQISYNGNRYQCVSKLDWYSQRGFITIMVVQID